MNREQATQRLAELTAEHNGDQAAARIALIRETAATLLKPLRGELEQLEQQPDRSHPLDT